MLSLLSPPARSERDWLYAAELDERLLAPNIHDTDPLHSRAACTFHLPWLARNSTNHQLDIPAHAPKNAPISRGNAKPAAGQAK